jgi:hypothetical protein
MLEQRLGYLVEYQMGCYFKIYDYNLLIADNLLFKNQSNTMNTLPFYRLIT